MERRPQSLLSHTRSVSCTITYVPELTSPSCPTPVPHQSHISHIVITCNRLWALCTIRAISVVEVQFRTSVQTWTSPNGTNGLVLQVKKFPNWTQRSVHGSPYDRERWTCPNAFEPLISWPRFLCLMSDIVRSAFFKLSVPPSVPPSSVFDVHWLRSVASTFCFRS